MKDHSRRNFLKGALKAGTAAAAVTAVGIAPNALKQTSPDQGRQGEEFQIWSTADGVCSHCEVTGIQLINTSAILGAPEMHNGKTEQVFLIQDFVTCPNCNNRIGKYFCSDVKYTRRKA